MKLFYLDVETTGLSAWKNDIIQLAYIIEVDDVVKLEREFKCQPHKFENVDPKALQVNGLTLDMLEEFEEPHIIQRALCKDLDDNVDKFNKNDKFTMVAYNGRFDFDFLKEWWKKCGQQYFGSYFNYQVIDPMVILQFLNIGWDLDMKDFKLGTACERFRIINEAAHDALGDVRATKKLLELLLSKLEFTFEDEEEEGECEVPTEEEVSTEATT